jgi:hypothetical protein
MSANAETTVKFCVDCRHCIQNNDDSEYSLCGRAKRNSGSEHRRYLVTGKLPPDEPSFCSAQRDYSGECGEDGKYFEAKEAK